MQPWLLQSALSLSHSSSTLVPHLLLYVSLFSCSMFRAWCVSPVGSDAALLRTCRPLQRAATLCMLGWHCGWSWRGLGKSTFDPELIVVILMDLVWGTLNLNNVATLQILMLVSKAWFSFKVVFEVSGNLGDQHQSPSISCFRQSRTVPRSPVSNRISHEMMSAEGSLS